MELTTMFAIMFLGLCAIIISIPNEECDCKKNKATPKTECLEASNSLDTDNPPQGD